MRATNVLFESFLLKSILAIILSSLTFLPVTCLAGYASQFQLAIPTLNSAANIDGELDDAIWQQAAVTELKYETQPGENIAALVKTEARVYATKTSLFVAFTAKDINPKLIRATLKDRDKLWSDDLVGIKLDTFNNARLAYQFFINPLGVQLDSIENELTGEESEAWDGIWKSAGKITADGYQVEVELPLRLFNFDDKKSLQEWGFELIRYYPRNEKHRLSTHKIDRNTSCQLCQLGVASGLAGAEQGQDVQITPTFIANRNEHKQADGWEADNNLEPGVDLRWGINSSTLLNATINPDFSQVESDAGQLDVNSTFSLFYDEKRPFFLDNKDYFDTQVNLLHTRNIVAPDYGIKLTSKSDDHTLALLASNDSQTTFLVPGNLSSEVASLDQESLNLAGRYRFDMSKTFSIGGLLTAKTSSDNTHNGTVNNLHYGINSQPDYHNYVISLDAKYQPTPQDSFTAQVAQSDTQYPTGVYRQFCTDTENDPSNGLPCGQSQLDCELGHCQLNEQVLRSQSDSRFGGNLYQLTFKHEERNWFAYSEYNAVDPDFRADLGFVEKIDYRTFEAGAGLIWYPTGTFNKVELAGDWDITHNQAGERLEEEYEAYIEILGALQSEITFGVETRERVGPRRDASQLTIAGNSQLYDETQVWFYGAVTPLSPLSMELEMYYGDEIDFINDRLGTKTQMNPSINWKIANGLSIDISHLYQQMDVEQGALFTANLSDVRLNWQFSLHSFIRLSSIYTRINRNVAQYLYSAPQSEEAHLGNELLYGYKLNPQSVFYLGYSDSLQANDELSRLTRDEKTYFMKLSYAWLL